MARTSVNDPAVDAVPVTPHDTNELGTITFGSETYQCRSLLIGTGGDLKVKTANGQTRTLTSVPAGVLPLQVKQVFSTGTTATNIVALY